MAQRDPFTSGESDNVYWLDQRLGLDRDAEREPRQPVMRFRSAEERRAYFAGKRGRQ